MAIQAFHSRCLCTYVFKLTPPYDFFVIDNIWWCNTLWFNLRAMCWIKTGDLTHTQVGNAEFCLHYVYYYKAVVNFRCPTHVRIFSSVGHSAELRTHFCCHRGPLLRLPCCTCRIWTCRTQTVPQFSRHLCAVSSFVNCPLAFSVFCNLSSFYQQAIVKIEELFTY